MNELKSLGKMHRREAEREMHDRTHFGSFSFILCKHTVSLGSSTFSIICVSKTVNSFPCSRWVDIIFIRSQDECKLQHYHVCFRESFHLLPSIQPSHNGWTRIEDYRETLACWGLIVCNLHCCYRWAAIVMQFCWAEWNVLILKIIVSERCCCCVCWMKSFQPYGFSA